MCAHVSPRNVGKWTIEKIFEGRGGGIPPPELDLRNWTYGAAFPADEELDLRGITPDRLSDSTGVFKIIWLRYPLKTQEQSSPLRDARSFWNKTMKVYIACL